MPASRAIAFTDQLKAKLRDLDTSERLYLTGFLFAYLRNIGDQAPDFLRFTASMIDTNICDAASLYGRLGITLIEVEASVQGVDIEAMVKNDNQKEGLTRACLEVLEMIRAELEAVNES